MSTLDKTKLYPPPESEKSKMLEFIIQALRNPLTSFREGVPPPPGPRIRQQGEPEAKYLYRKFDGVRG